MLSLLRISNYAIIDDLEIELFPGFSVMSGETGAGKSILVDALGLALGDRADASAVRSGSARADISLVFELEPAHPAAAWLAERGLDEDELCCLRRTITTEGRSRAFINNHPVPLRDLRAVGELLVDIHGQHAHQSLLTAAVQRELLDASGGHGAESRAVAAAFGEWQDARRELEKKTASGTNRQAELELLRFQHGELAALALAPGEAAALREESERLANVEDIRQAMGLAAEALYESDAASAHGLASQAARALESVVGHDRSLEELCSRVASAEIELREVAADLSRRLDRIEADPARLDEIEARLDRIQQLARRHRVTEDELAGLADRLAAEIASLESGAESVEALATRVAKAEERYDAAAERLSEARRKAAAALGKAVTEKLRGFGLEHAEFVVSIVPKQGARKDSTGTDQIEFCVTTNPGEPPGPIDRIASGGELSRIGLALSVIATDASSIPTLVFDEVDAGIGGAVAEVVGRNLRRLGERHQVLCVTHLPQVASQGGRHYRIVKLTDGKTSRTQVRVLDSEQRVEELSRMLGGVEITAATRAHAEEMIRQAAAAS